MLYSSKTFHEIYLFQPLQVSYTRRSSNTFLMQVVQYFVFGNFKVLMVRQGSVTKTFYKIFDGTFNLMLKVAFFLSVALYHTNVHHLIEIRVVCKRTVHQIVSSVL